MARKISLQKLTETDKKISCLLAKKKITKAEVLKVLNDDEINEFNKIITQKLNELKGDELDKLLHQIDDLLPTDSRNQIWENNHYQITASMAKQIEEFGKMPTKNQISSDTGLSRQTVSKHLNCYAEHPLYSEQLQQFKFMADRVLAKVIKLAGQGDIKAARLYFDIIGNSGNKNDHKTTISTQNNYIQINNTRIDEIMVNQLPVDARLQIEGIIKQHSHKPE